MDRIEIKTTENQIGQIIQRYEYLPKVAGALVRTVTDHLRSNYGNLQHDGQIGYMVVIREEPAGKPLRACEFVKKLGEKHQLNSNRGHFFHYKGV
ncbi:MAG: hypothetical protein AYK18_18080 [Theionarchaea archaeon DG-70]|nr:MAG: hypothetical protein AYK18_18080 [Theionarchaea archaeon DG-70]